VISLLLILKIKDQSVLYFLAKTIFKMKISPLKKLLLNSSLLLIITFFSCQSPLMRANKNYYLGVKAMKHGKLKKAEKRLEDASRLDPKNDQYAIRMAGLQLKLDNPKKAMKYINRIHGEETNNNIEEEIELVAWKSIYAMNLGQRKESIRLTQEALDLMKLHKITNDTLKSTLFTNRAVTEIFDQSKNVQPKKDFHFKNVHRRDFKRAYKYLNLAVALNSNNCIAAYNQTVIKNILSTPDSFWHYGYLADSSITKLSKPIFDCEPPEPTVSTTKFSFGQVHSALIDKEEILLVLDISGSMSSRITKGDKEGSRLELMKQGVISLLDNLDPEVKVGIITVGGSCEKRPLVSLVSGQANREELKAVVRNLTLYGGTPLTDRLITATRMFQSDKSSKAIFLCSDGIGGCSYRNNTCDLGTLFNEKNIQFYVFSLLLESGSSMEYSIYNCIVNATNGMLVGVTESKTIEEKTVGLAQKPFSIPLSIGDIETGNMTPHKKEKAPLLNDSTIITIAHSQTIK